MVEGITLVKVENQETIELNMDTSEDYVLQSVDWGVIGSNHYSYKYVNQIGVYITGTSLETREINIIGWVLGPDENAMTERKGVLNRFINPTQAIDLRYKGYVLRFLPNTSIRYSVEHMENNRHMCKFKIEGIAPDPMFVEQNEQRIPGITTVGKFHFPLTLGIPHSGSVEDGNEILPTAIFGIREPSLLMTIENIGAIPVGMRIIFKAIGSTGNPELTNVVTGEFFRVNKTMVAGEEIEVNSIIGSKKVIGRKGIVEENYFEYKDLDSSWLQLRPGDNIFRYDATNPGAIEVYIYFYTSFLEVQQCN